MNLQLQSKNQPRAKLITLFIFLGLFALNAYAEGEQTTPARNNPKLEPLVVTLSAQKVQLSANGKETLIKADKVKPGDLVQYVAVYRNRSKNSINELNASLPVPLGMEYVAKSARPLSVFASTDGSKYEAEPLMRIGKDKNGNAQQSEVPYPEYRSLRWAVGNLGAGKKIEVSARMRVTALPPSPEELVTKPQPANQLKIN